MAKINLDKHVWEGWRVRDFIEDLQPSIDMIQAGHSHCKKFETREQVKKWCMDNQPYYKKYIPDVVNYFCQRHGL